MQEEFVVTEPVAAVWEFIEQVERVAMCVPGVEEVTVLDDDNLRVRMTQAVGPMTATFDLKMQITERDPGRAMGFSAVGRAVKGAAGNVRATNRVELAEDGDGTRVILDGDIGLGGMLGSVGQKVLAKQAAATTRQFAAALERQLVGAPQGAASEPAPAPPGAAPAPRGAVAVDLSSLVTQAVIAGAVAVVLALLLRRFWPR